MLLIRLLVFFFLEALQAMAATFEIVPMPHGHPWLECQLGCPWI